WMPHSPQFSVSSRSPMSIASPMASSSRAFLATARHRRLYNQPLTIEGCPECQEGVPPFTRHAADQELAGVVLRPHAGDLLHAPDGLRGVLAAVRAQTLHVLGELGSAHALHRPIPSSRKASLRHID